MTARLNPDAAASEMQAAGLIPLVPYLGNKTPWRCRCVACGTEVTPTLVHVRDGHGCRACGSRKSCDTRRLDPRATEAFMLEHGFRPLEPYPGSDLPWRCEHLRCGTEVTPRYIHIKTRGGGCPACSYRGRADRQRSPERVAIAEMRAAGIEPLEPFRGTNFPWLGRCLSCNQQVSPRLARIRGGYGGCRFCAGQVVDPEAAATFMRARGVNPLVDYPGGGVPWKCQCLKCGNVVTPRYSVVRFGQGPCKHCRPYGFNPENDGIVYLLSHSALGAVKVGIGARAGFRLQAHAKHGWQVVASVPVRGELAVEIEKVILDWWRIDLGLPPYLSKREMPQGGWTETVDADAVDIPATIARIGLLAA